MCCLKIDTETLLANCLNTCKTYSFSPDDLQQIVRLMANATDRYIFSDTGDDALHEIVTKFPDMFVYADENTIVSHNKQELEVVASGMEAMGLSVETGYFDPDDESSVDVSKQLIGFHYVVLKKKV